MPGYLNPYSMTPYSDPDQNIDTGNDTNDRFKFHTRFRKLIDNSYEGISLLDRNLNIVYHNASAAHISGLVSTHGINTILDLAHRDDIEKLKQVIVEVLANQGQPASTRFRARHIDGHYTWISIIFTNYLDDPDIGAIVLNWRDVTKEKEAEDKLLISEKRFKALLENGAEGIVLYNADRKPLYISPAFGRIFGYNEEEVSRLNEIKVTHPDDFAYIQVKFFESLNKPGIPIKDIIYRMLHKDGHWVYLNSTLTNFLNDPDIMGVVNNFTDISVKTQSLQTLERTKADLEKIMDSSLDMICTIDQQGCFLKVSASSKTILGYEPKELAGRPAFDFIYPEDRDKTRKLLGQHMDGGDFTNIENRYIRKDGSLAYLSWSSRWSDKDKTRYATARDVSEKKANDQALIESENKYRSLFKYNPIPLFLWDLDTLNIIDCNEAAVQKYGYSKEEFLKLKTKNIWAKGYKPSDGDGREEIDYSVDKPFKRVRQHQKKNGELLFVEVSGQVLIYEGKKAVLAMANDITEKSKVEELLDKANSLARIGAWDLDMKTNIIHWSDITKEILETEDISNYDIQPALNLYPEGENRDVIANMLKRTAANGAPGDVEAQITTFKGNLKWVRVIVEAEFKGKTCTRLFGSFQDIDARKKAELTAHEALEERNIILESIGDAFFAVNKNWVVTYWNNMAEKVLGKSKKEMRNRELWDVFADSIDSLSYKMYHNALETNLPVHFEDYYAPLLKWYEISAYPSAAGLSVYFKDITDRKLAEKSILELNESLKNQAKELSISNAELEQFAYVASHDLQEPLRMVTSFLTQLEKKYGDVIDEKGKRYINFAVDGAKRMRQIILDLLEFSRIGNTEDDLEDIDLNKLIADISILFRKQIQEEKATIVFNNLPVIESYRTPLRQVFQNLISNSLKYHKQEIAPLIQISCEELPTLWKFSVSDNGIGISQDYFEKIFIIFQRLHNKEEYSGTGMGLAIAKKIIENLGGKIWLTSVLGQGSIFNFTILKKRNSA